MKVVLNTNSNTGKVRRSPTDSTTNIAISIVMLLLKRRPRDTETMASRTQLLLEILRVAGSGLGILGGLFRALAVADCRMWGVAVFMIVQ